MANVRFSQITLTELDARALSDWFVDHGPKVPEEVRSALVSVVAQLRNLEGARHNRPFVDPRR